MAHGDVPAVSASQADMVRVEVVYCPDTTTTDLVGLTLPAGSSVADALQASGLPARHALGAADLHVGVWGRTQPMHHVLRDRDRVEVYRPLTVDPKEARRQRYQQHRGQQVGQRRGTAAGQGAMASAGRPVSDSQTR